MTKPKTQPNALVSIEEQIKKQLAEQNKHLGALPANKISTKGKQFTLPDGTSSAGPMKAVILDYTWFFVHYPGVFNASAPQQPDCWAIGRDKPDSGLLVPHPDVEKPYSDNCRDCPKNQWKSGSGNGKACKNQRRLLITTPNATVDSEPMTLYVSPGALKNFDGYASQLQSIEGVLPIQVITEISFDPNQAYPSLLFKFAEKHDNLQTMWALRERHQDMLFRSIELSKKEDAA